MSKLCGIPSASLGCFTTLYNEIVSYCFIGQVIILDVPTIRMLWYFTHQRLSSRTYCYRS